jgi:hypothetical protein
MWSNARLRPAFLIYFHIVVCCLSLIYVAELSRPEPLLCGCAQYCASRPCLNSFLIQPIRLRLHPRISFLHYDPGLPLARRLFAFQLRSRTGGHFNFWLRLGIPRSCVVYHLAAQAKIYPIYPGAGEAAVFHLDLRGEYRRRRLFLNFQADRRRRYLQRPQRTAFPGLAGIRGGRDLERVASVSICLLRCAW